MKITAKLLILFVVASAFFHPLPSSAGPDDELLLSTTGLPPTNSVDFPKIIACSIFGAIGFVAFMYGKRRSLLQPTVIGISLIAFPYFVSSGTVAICIIGCILTAALFFFKN